jgi:CubicO group peptidase (beta-lactamase class C family)
VIPRRLARALGAWLSGLGSDAAGFSRGKRRMQHEIDTGEIAGSVILLARHGRLVLNLAQGWLDLESGSAMRRDAIFRIRSNTKPVTGVAMMILYERGLWTLDDPVASFIPEFAGLQVATGVDSHGEPVLEPISRPPTMRELLTHTAGFAYGLAPDGIADTAYFEAGVLTAPDAQAMIERIAAQPMFGQPGEAWRYSIAADIQGAIIERLSGMPLAQFMAESIFGPLGMTDTAFHVPPAKLDRLAALYDVGPGGHGLARQPERNGVDISAPPSLASGGGGLMSTAADYGRFAQMILNGGELDGVRLLRPETVALMRRNQLPASFMVTTNGTRASPLGKGVGFGLDWAVWVDPAAAGSPVGRGSVSWGGSAGTWAWIDLANDLYFVGMVQRLGGTGGGLDAATRALTYQALVGPSK